MSFLTHSIQGLEGQLVSNKKAKMLTLVHSLVTNNKGSDYCGNSKHMRPRTTLWLRTSFCAKLLDWTQLKAEALKTAPSKCVTVTSNEVLNANPL